MNRRSIWIMVCAFIVSMAFTRVAQSDALAPTVTGPITGGNGVPILFSHGSFDLATVGYQQTEFFITGTANSYSPLSPLTSDGRWSVAASTDSAPYVTRIVVDRPIRDRDFNGTVVVEWFNVSGQVDASPSWTFVHTELIRKGYAYVAVSAQFIGVNQLKNGGVAPGDPVRYASLNHPTDSYSYDIFSQAGQAIRSSAKRVLGGLHPRRLIAAGESQSAGRLVTYVNAVHPLVEVYDGFLIGSRGAGGAPLAQPPLTTVLSPVPARIRDDLTAPVLVFNSETDAGALLARQDDSAVYRLWEVAGSSHFDLYGLFQGQFDTGRQQSVTDWFNSMLNPPTSPTPTANCPMPVNTGPRTFVQRAALAALNRWIAFGIQPPSAERLQTVSISPVQYALDANGNVLGGIRTPAVDAPVAKLSGMGQTGSGAQFCFLFGTTVPFTAEQLAEQYGSHAAFVIAWSRATLDAVKEGFLLPQDAVDILVVGAHADVP